MARIYYISHDVPEITGGVSVLYRHVSLLRSHGFDAKIVQSSRGYRYPAALPDVPVIHSNIGFGIEKDDWIVLPEDHLLAIRSTKGANCRKCLFCQNHYYLGITSEAVQGVALNRFGFSAFMCVSEPIRQAMAKWWGVDATIVRPSIDTARFRPTQKTSSPSIAYMPRKGREHVNLAKSLLDAVGVRATWTEIDRLAPNRVAELLGQCWIYLATGRFEGLGLPPLEAMAAGALVVGFTAGGGRDYATEQNGIWVADDDPYALATGIRHTLELMSSPKTDSAVYSILGAARSTVEQRYTLESEKQSLLSFWTKRMEPGS